MILHNCRLVHPHRSRSILAQHLISADDAGHIRIGMHSGAMVTHLILSLVPSLGFIVVCYIWDALLAVHRKEVWGRSTNMIHKLGWRSYLSKLLSIHK